MVPQTPHFMSVPSIISQSEDLIVTVPQNPLDKKIAATALLYDLALVTRNVKHFASTGVRLIDPFASCSDDRKRPPVATKPNDRRADRLA